MVETSEINLDRGVIDPSHPPIIGVVVMDASSSALKAGTILKLSSGKYSGASDSDDPAAVLVQDVEAHANGTVNARVLLHGLAVSSRLLTGAQASATDTLKNKLPATGIYLTQAVWDESNFN